MYQLMQRPPVSTAMSHLNQRGSGRDSPVDLATRILIVDGDRNVGTSLTFMLSVRGYEEVRSVRSPRRAVSLAQIYHPALVFLDYDLPDPGALDLANQLRKGAQQHALRLIALTTSSEHERREEARAAGFERYLMKPLSQVELDKILRIPAPSVL